MSTLPSDLFGEYYRRRSGVESRRLERGQFCRVPVLYLLDPMRVALTENALWFASEWMRHYLTGDIEPMFEKYRRETLQAIL